jgi:hypothetical protein
VHDGIAQMFQIIEYARMMVGTKAIATLSTGYLNALEYAKERVQGADLAQMTDKAAPRVTITHHPDVRRSLMLQKAYAEGLRALVLYTATWQDKVAVAGRRRGDTDDEARPPAVNDLLLPIVKGVGSERAYELLGSRCRPSAAPASCRTTRSSSTSATPRSTPCTRAPPRSRPRLLLPQDRPRTRARLLDRLLPGPGRARPGPQLGQQVLAGRVLGGEGADVPVQRALPQSGHPAAVRRGPQEVVGVRLDLDVLHTGNVVQSVRDLLGAQHPDEFRSVHGTRMRGQFSGRRLPAATSCGIDGPVRYCSPLPG